LLPDRLALLHSLFFCLVECFMLFELLIAADAGKVRLEAEAATLGAFSWMVWLVLLVSVLAGAAGPPGVYVETFSAR